MKKNSNSQTKSGQKTKSAKARGPVQRDSKEVMAELVAKLSERLGPRPMPEDAKEPHNVPAPNRDRLTLGLDLGDQWSNYCILGLEGETLAAVASGRRIRSSADGCTSAPASKAATSPAAITIGCLLGWSTRRMALLNVRWKSSDRLWGERGESIVIVTLRPANANATLKHYLNIS